MADAEVPGEHEVHETLSVDVYYPDHPPRTESHTFRVTKRFGHKKKLPCAISGRPHPEYHHVFIEWADADAVDWETVKGVATGKIPRLPVLDAETDQPTNETYPAEHSLIWMICRLAELRGFKWDRFDPSKPEQFVDSMANMLPLTAKFHRHKFFGIHMLPGPIWNVFAWPRRKDVMLTPQERHQP